MVQQAWQLLKENLKTDHRRALVRRFDLYQGRQDVTPVVDFGPRQAVSPEKPLLLSL
jgi:hypothetical protein